MMPLYFHVLSCRHLTGEIAQEWQDLDEEKEGHKAKQQELNRLINEVVPYLMGHNAEAEACDILMEVEKLTELEQYVDESAFTRVCLYLKRWASLPSPIFSYPLSHLMSLSSVCSCVPYVPEPENTNLLKTAMGIYRKFNQFPDAMTCALALNDMDLVKEIFLSCEDL